MGTKEEGKVVMGSIEKFPRVLIVAVEAQGHLVPLLQLLQQLVTKKISFTVCTTPGRCEELRSSAKKGAFGLLEVEFPEVFTDPGAIGLSVKLVPTMIKDFEYYHASGSLDSSRYTCMISDMILFFCQDLADEWGIPNYYFFTSPSYFGLVLLHLADVQSGGWTPTNFEKRDKFIDLPGLEKFKADDVPRPVLFQLQPDAFQHVPRAIRRAAGLLINSFEEFDMTSADDLRRELQSNPSPGKVKWK